MENRQNSRYPKGHLQAQLRRRAEQLSDKIKAYPASDAELISERIYAFLREETLKSWQRGKDQGPSKSTDSEKRA